MLKQSLNGNWQFRRTDSDWLPAYVPGSVYADLLREKKIEDPYYRENESAAFDALRHSYEYQRTFSVDAELLDCEAVQLCCEGLDTLCSLFINGIPIGKANNMHRIWLFDVRSALHKGENDILIRFDSPIVYALNEYEKRPCWGMTDAIPGFSHLRKAHSMFGWDWGARLPDAGIWRPISLLGITGARIQSVRIEQQHDENGVLLRFFPEIETLSAAQPAVRISVRSPEGDTLSADESQTLRIQSPKLWWPAGYGDQPLYTVFCELTDGTQVLDTWTRRIGLRTMTLDRKPDAWGESFCHTVNGLPIFAMGADYIPEDSILSRRSPDRTRRLLEDARLAHFNTIRVWGGGFYPDDFFYDLCDELGLLVWQDFMFACAFYDLTPAFEQSVTAEIADNLRRIRHHACLALLCGNNEMELFHKQAADAQARGLSSRFTPRRPSHLRDYMLLFERLLPQMVQTLAPQIPYWPSSPSSGGALDSPNDENRGDVHDWDVWHGEKPFFAYRNHLYRYVSEFGFQAFPCQATIEAFTLPNDRNIFSPVMERHQRNKSANGKILAYLAQNYRLPENFSDLLYLSQLLQADAVRCGVEHWRSHRGRCMGAIYWQLNDCWPVASWSSIDYYGRWKALHYAARRFFAPVMLCCREEGEHTQRPQINDFSEALIRCSASLTLCNETRTPVSGRVLWALRTADGAAVKSGAFPAVVPALSIQSFPALDLNKINYRNCYLSYALIDKSNSVISQGTALFCAPKRFEFSNPHLSVRRAGNTLIVRADAYAQSVYIESEDPDLLLDDNFFSMNPGEQTVRILRGKATFPIVRSIYDCVYSRSV